MRVDDTFARIAELLSRRRAELQRHIDTANADMTTTELLDRVQRLQTRLDSSPGMPYPAKKPDD